MRTLKISFLVFILSMSIYAQWYEQKLYTPLNFQNEVYAKQAVRQVPLNLIQSTNTNYKETDFKDYYFIDSLIAENTVGGKFKYLFEYNTNGKINKWIRYWVTNGNLMEYQKLEYFYDSYNREFRTILFRWINDSWDSLHQTLKEYNLSNQLISQIDQGYSNNSWENDLKTTYTYDLNGNEKTVLRLFWYNNQWENSYLTNNYYSSGNLKDSTIIQWFINEWKNYYKFTYNYNDTTKFLEKTLTQIWSDTHWENLSNLIITNDQNGNPIEHLVMYWSSGNNWENDIRKQFTFYSNYIVSGYCEKWDGLNWVPDDDLFVIKNPDGFILELIINNFIAYYKIVGVEPEYEVVVGIFKLEQNYPNPFNPSTKIKFTIPQSDNPLLGGARGGLVTLKVYDVLGNEVATLVNEEKPSGEYEVTFDSHSGNVRNLTSGVYFYRLQAGSFVETKKMILLK